VSITIINNAYICAYVLMNIIRTSGKVYRISGHFRYDVLT